MAESEPRKWIVGLQPVQGGEVRHLGFDWAGTPTLEEAADMALSQLEPTPRVTTPVPTGADAPNQTALKGRGYEIVSLSEAARIG